VTRTDTLLLCHWPLHWPARTAAPVESEVCVATRARAMKHRIVTMRSIVAIMGTVRLRWIFRADARIDVPLAGCLAMPHVVVRRTLDEHRSIAMTTLEDRACMHSTHRTECVTCSRVRHECIATGMS
jgi:hypothetical protein